MTEADLAEAARLHKSITKGHGYRLDVLLTLPFVWLIALVPAFWSEGLVLFSAVVGAALGFCVYPIWRLWSWRRGTRALSMELREFMWSETGIAITTRFGTSFYDWARLKQWAAADGMFLLYANLRVFQILPRRVFSGLVEVLQMEGYLSDAGVRRVGPRRR